jgi:hypothetical protein
MSACKEVAEEEARNSATDMNWTWKKLLQVTSQWKLICVYYDGMEFVKKFELYLRKLPQEAPQSVLLIELYFSNNIFNFWHENNDF